MVTMTQTGDLSSDQAAYETLAFFGLRSEQTFTNAFTVRPTRQSHRGSSVIWTLNTEMSSNTGALTEATDVTPVDMADSTVTVTLVEYGAAIKTSAKLRGTSFFEVDVDAANLIGYNAGLSTDEIARDVLGAGTNVIYGNDATSTASVGSGDTVVANDFRYMVAKLRGSSARGWFGMNYACFIHPDISVDLREETGTDAWTDAAVHGDSSRIWSGAIGSFAGATFIETPRIEVQADAGNGNYDVYDTIMTGQQCGAMSFSSNVSGPTPRIVFGPQTDILRRFNVVGWYQLAGWSRFRDSGALYRLEASSTIGSN